MKRPCPSERQRFPTQAAALHHLKTFPYSRPLRPVKCQKCPDWHLEPAGRHRAGKPSNRARRRPDRR